MVVLPTLEQARAFATPAGVPPNIAEIWLHECEARRSRPRATYGDRDGQASALAAHLTSLRRKWEAE